ncbi:MAG: lantibiotic dehydratase family protein [Verrucomicrobiota bacterium]|nr:lantibiotic dehydratase family protein [Verrucomicrobiota bacterium]
MPFEAVENLATPKAFALARQVIERETENARAIAAAEEFFRSRERLLEPEVYHELRQATRLNRPPRTFSDTQPPVFSNYAATSTAVHSLQNELEASLDDEVSRARLALLQASREFLPAYLVFGAENVREFLTDELASEHGSLPARNNAARKIEQSALLYLQRIAAKNDTFSRFGPSSWGRADNLARGATLQIVPGIARNEAFPERWTAHAFAGAVNADAEAFAYFIPRLNPNGLLMGDRFVFADSGEAIDLSGEDLALLKKCAGSASVATLGEAAVRELVSRNILLAALEVAALEPFALAQMRDDIASWKPCAARSRWLTQAEALLQLAADFAGEQEPARRREILGLARGQFSTLGAERKAEQRSLYSAINPIAEECFRQADFVLEQRVLDEVAIDAEPWIDFWRDSFAFVASRVAAGLRMIFEKAPTRNGALPLPAFLRACEMAKLPLTGSGLVGLSVMAFQEIKAAFRQRMQPHAALDEYELTTADCHFVRDNFQYDKFDEFTYPSGDLQLAASSADAIARGEYQWILSELHPPAALLHHAGYWSCPDQPTLDSALSSIAGRSFHFGFFAADFTAHTTVRAFDAMPELTTFVAPQRANPTWKQFPPSHTEVYLDEKTNDVRLCHAVTREDLGSFARNWIIPLGFHPFQFGLSPQMPRLRCGRVIVQRRAWAIAATELAPGKYHGVSRELVVAVERLRAARNLPRYVYIRPTEQSLRRSGAEGRDKDTKPIFIDLESYLFVEIFHRWLTKAGELEVTEMLPAPDDLWWREADGRRTFELRTLIVPRS